MRSFIAALLILAMIFIFTIPQAVKINEIKNELSALIADTDQRDCESSLPHINKIEGIINSNKDLIVFLLPKSIYEPLYVSFTRLSAFAREGEEELFRAEREVFIYYINEMEF